MLAGTWETWEQGFMFGPLGAQRGRDHSFCEVVDPME